METKVIYNSIAILTLTLAIFFPKIILAQDANSTTKSEWTFLVEPYLLFPNMSGTVA